MSTKMGQEIKMQGEPQGSIGQKDLTRPTWY